MDTKKPKKIVIEITYQKNKMATLVTTENFINDGNVEETLAIIGALEKVKKEQTEKLNNIYKGNLNG